VSGFGCIRSRLYSDLSFLSGFCCICIRISGFCIRLSGFCIRNSGFCIRISDYDYRVFSAEPPRHSRSRSPDSAIRDSVVGFHAPSSPLLCSGSRFRSRLYSVSAVLGLQVSGFGCSRIRISGIGRYQVLSAEARKLPVIVEPALQTQRGPCRLARGRNGERACGVFCPADFGFRVSGCGFRVSGFGFRVPPDWVSGLRRWGFGFGI
jgi:hypothetical protein